MGTYSTDVRTRDPLPLAMVRPEWGKPRLNRGGPKEFRWVCTSSPYGVPIYSYAPDPLRAYLGWVQAAELQARDLHRGKQKRGWLWRRK